MITVSSTPEKNIATLTGNECIPLSDKTHIKTKVLLDMQNKLDKALTKDNITEYTAYRREYILNTEEGIQDALEDNTIISNNKKIENNILYFKGYFKIKLPRKSAYYIRFYGCESTNENIKNIIINNVSFEIGNFILLPAETISEINIQVSDYVKIDKINIMEEPELFVKEIEKHESKVENNCLILNL